MPFEMSIELPGGAIQRHGFHLGTDERVAREIVAEKFAARNANGYPTVTIALMRAGKMIDCFDGRWASEYAE